MAGIYGLKIKDSSGNVIYITPETSSLVSAGSVIPPTTLRIPGTDDTFGTNVKLPGTGTFFETSIGIVAAVNDWVTSFGFLEVPDSIAEEQWYYMKWLNPDVTYYEYDKSTGAMTEFVVETVPGSDPAIPKDTLYNQHGIVFWDKGSTEQSGHLFDTVRLFSAVVNYIYDRSAMQYKIVYSIGTIYTMDYAVFLKNLSGV